jgi:arylsulfatase A-like enzyme
MDVYGYERQTTPFITEWAKNAVVFNRSYASSNWTTPATMSLMTGQRLWTHRVWHQAIYQPVRNYQHNLPGILSKYGYDVYGFVANIYAHPETLGIKNAFLHVDKANIFETPVNWWFDDIADLFASRPLVRRWMFSKNQLAKLITSYRPDILKTKYPAELVYNRFLEVISDQDHDPENPFFAWLHVNPPHDPYLPDESIMGSFGDGKEFNTAQEQYGVNPFHSNYDSAKQGKVDILRKRYDEFILYSDEQFKLLMHRLSEVIDMSNTIIILTSDHGESFTHGFLGHNGPHLFEPLVHIPLIVRLPGEMQGGQIDVPVEQIDVAPTILELAGLPIPEWMEGQSLVSFFKFNQGKSRPVLSMQLNNNRSLGEPITTGTIAAWEGDYKLIYYIKDSKDNKTMLFNVRADPGENHNISDEKPEIVQRLLSLIRDDLFRANKKIELSH